MSEFSEQELASTPAEEDHIELMKYVATHFKGMKQ